MSGSQLDIILADLVPPIEEAVLDLSGWHIASLEGLADIDDIETVTTLDMSNNRLTALGDRVLAPLERLAHFSAADNYITRVTEDAFAGCIDLKTINLRNNIIVTASVAFDLPIDCSLEYSYYTREKRLMHKTARYAGDKFPGFNTDIIYNCLNPKR